MLEIYTIAIIALIIASYSDIKTREVPDWLSYALIFTAIGLRTILTFFYWDISYLLEGLFGLAVFVGVAYAFFYSGQWGGGDSKLLMGLGALIGLRYELSLQFIFIFLLNLIIVGAVYGLVWSITLAMLNRKRFRQESVKIMQRFSRIRKIVLTTTIALIVLSFLFTDRLASLSFLILGVLALLLFYVFMFAKSVENACLIKTYPVSKLTEGDWIFEDVKYKGKLLVSSKNLGITKKQICLLKKHKIKSVLVKEGMPFVPVFLISFILTWLLGNWFLVM